MMLFFWSREAARSSGARRSVALLPFLLMLMILIFEIDIKLASNGNLKPISILAHLNFNTHFLPQINQNTSFCKALNKINILPSPPSLLQAIRIKYKWMFFWDINDFFNLFCSLIVLCSVPHNKRWQIRNRISLWLRITILR